MFVLCLHISQFAENYWTFIIYKPDIRSDIEVRYGLCAIQTLITAYQSQMQKYTKLFHKTFISYSRHHHYWTLAQVAVVAAAAEVAAVPFAVLAAPTVPVLDVP